MCSEFSEVRYGWLKFESNSGLGPGFEGSIQVHKLYHIITFVDVYLEMSDSYFHSHKKVPTVIWTTNILIAWMKVAVF